MWLEGLCLIILFQSLPKVCLGYLDNEYYFNDDDLISSQEEKRRMPFIPLRAPSLLRRSEAPSPFISSVQTLPPGQDYANYDSLVNSPMETLETPKRIGDTDVAFSLKSQAHAPVQDQSAAEKLVGDVNRYGLWEYTTDNTDVGREIKQLLKSSKSSVRGNSHGESLEKQAYAMNEKINSYLEVDNVSPTVDPMETPEGFDEKVASVASSSVNKFPSSNGQSVDFITIPNSMSIEDELGNHLATIKEKRHQATQRDRQKHLPLLALESSLTKHETERAEAKKHPSNFNKQSESLAIRLLKALRHNKKFREQVKFLLDTEENEESMQDKPHAISSLVRGGQSTQTRDDDIVALKSPHSEYTGDILNSFDDLPLAMIKNVDSKLAVRVEDAKLMSILDKLIRNNVAKSTKKVSEARTQLHTLKNSLKNVEKELLQMESEAQRSEEEVEHDQARYGQKQTMANSSTDTASLLDTDQPLGKQKDTTMKGYFDQKPALLKSIDDSHKPRFWLQALAAVLKKREHAHLSHV